MHNVTSNAFNFYKYSIFSAVSMQVIQSRITINKLQRDLPKVQGIFVVEC